MARKATLDDIFGKGYSESRRAKSFGSSISSDPLASRERQNENARLRIAAAGGKDKTIKPNPSGLDRIFGVLDAAGTAGRSLFYNSLNRGDQQDVDILDEVGKSLRGEEHITSSRLVKDAGFDDPMAQGVAGFLLDVLLDPLTYVSAGTTGVGKSLLTSTVDDIVRAGKPLAEVGLDASKIASLKNAGLVDDAGKLLGLPADKAAANALFDDIADALVKRGDIKGGIRFAGIPLTKQSTVNKLARGAREVGNRVPGVATLGKGFGMGELSDVYREGSDLTRAWLKASKNNLAQQRNMAKLIGARIADEVADLVPDERARLAITKGISEQFGTGDTIAPLLDALDEQKAAHEALNAFRKTNARKIRDGVADTMKELADLETKADAARTAVAGIRGRLFDPTAITRNLEAVGLEGDDLARALDGYDKVLERFNANLAEKSAVLPDARPLFGRGGTTAAGEAVPDSAGFIPGMEPRRDAGTRLTRLLGQESDADRLGRLTQEVFGTEQGAKMSGGLGEVSRGKFLGAGKEAAKKYTLPTDRLAADIATELDIAPLVGAKTTQDMRRVAFQRFSDDVMKVATDSNAPELGEALRRLEPVFTQDEATKGFLKALDGVTNVWRSMATILNPGFTPRNWTSNKAFMFFKDAKMLDPALHAETIGIMANKGDDIVRGLGMTQKEFLKEAADHRIMQDIDDVFGIIGGKGRRNPVTRTLGKMNEAVEQSDRLIAYLYARRKGLDPKAASDFVQQTLLDYDPKMLTVFEQNVMRRLMPFYTFSRRAAPAVAETLLKQPGKITGIGHLTANMEAASPEDESLQPEWMRNAQMLALPFKSGTQYLSLTGLLPVGELEKVSPFQSPQETVREMLASSNPFVRDLLIEFPLNHDIFRGGEVSRFAGDKRPAPKWVDAFDRLVTKLGIDPVDGFWQSTKTALGITPDKRGNLTMNAYASKALSDFIPWMQTVGKMGVAASDGDTESIIARLAGLRLEREKVDEWRENKIWEDARILDDELSRLRQEGEVPTTEEARRLPLTLRGGR